MRRAVCAAYHAIFHVLIDAASRFAVRGNDRAGLRHAVTGGFDRGEMKSAARSFEGGTLPSVLQRAAGGRMQASGPRAPDERRGGAGGERQPNVSNAAGTRSPHATDCGAAASGTQG